MITYIALMMLAGLIVFSFLEKKIDIKSAVVPLFFVFSVISPFCFYATYRMTSSNADVAIHFAKLSEEAQNENRKEIYMDISQEYMKYSSVRGIFLSPIYVYDSLSLNTRVMKSISLNKSIKEI